MHSLLIRNKINTMTEGERFLNYVAANTKRLKNNLRKNITYDPNIFEDVFNETILNVYDYLKRTNRVIKDFEQFFFICSKNKYIQEDNKERARKEAFDWDFIDNHKETLVDDSNEKEREEKLTNINVFFQKICERLEGLFPDNEVDVFMIYYKLKTTKNKVSYKKMAHITNTNITYIAQVIKTIRDYVRNDDEIKKLKKYYIG